MESVAIVVASQKATVNSISLRRSRGLSLFHKRQPGQSMTEYALILALVVVVGLATWALLGSNITSTIQGLVNCL
jgi:Flp pilus assembly pilin Flp